MLSLQMAEIFRQANTPDLFIPRLSAPLFTLRLSATVLSATLANRKSSDGIVNDKVVISYGNFHINIYIP